MSNHDRSLRNRGIEFRGELSSHDGGMLSNLAIVQRKRKERLMRMIQKL